MYTWPQVPQAEMYQAYNSGYPAHIRPSFRPAKPSRRKAALMSLFYRNLRWLPSLPRGAHILDIGCSTGEFLAERDNGWERHGVDVSTAAVEMGHELYGLDLHHGRMDGLDFPDNHFDAVTCWHTFEHVYDPKLYLREIGRVLKPGGYFVMAVPNAGCWQQRVFGGSWYHLHLPYHLHHWSEKRLRELFEETGDLNVEKVLYGPQQAQMVSSLGIFLSSGRLGGWGKRLGHELQEYMRASFERHPWMAAVKLALLPLEYSLIPLHQSDEMVFVSRKPAAPR
jgi:SAM-dependent methyltransferase